MTDSYKHIFDNEVAEIDLLELIKNSKDPVLDLKPLCGIYEREGSSRLPSVVLTPFLQLSVDMRRKFKFIGERGDAEKLLNYVPEFKDALLSNPSFAKLLE